VRVALLAEEAGLSLEISDDGQGFDPASVAERDGRQGIGLTSMRERVEYTGGQFSVRSGENEGTTIRATWPR
jgi:two-component system NarL family sensor kinase